MIDVEKLKARQAKHRQRCRSWYRKNRAKHIAHMREYRQAKRGGTFIPKAVMRDPEKREELRRILAVRPDYRFE